MSGITVLQDVVLNNNVITAGVRGKRHRKNDRVQTDSGLSSVTQGWTKTLRSFEIGIAPMRMEQWQQIIAIHEVTEGGAYGFLIEDPSDCTCATGIFEEIEPGQYQMFKRYTHSQSTRTKDREITRPRPGTIVVANNGVVLVEGVGYTMDPETGIVSIASNPDAAQLTWTGRFYVPVHFMDDTLDWDLVVAGPTDSRYMATSSTMLMEIREGND